VAEFEFLDAFVTCHFHERDDRNELFGACNVAVVRMYWWYQLRKLAVYITRSSRSYEYNEVFLLA